MRYALRSLLKAREFTVVAVAVMAIGIGATMPSSASSTRRCGRCRSPTPNGCSCSPASTRRAASTALRSPIRHLSSQESPLVVIVSQNLARRVWPDQPPIGRTLLVGRFPAFAEVVGVVGEVKNNGLANEPVLAMYTPYAQRPWPAMQFVLRAKGGDPLALSGAGALQCSTSIATCRSLASRRWTRRSLIRSPRRG